MKKKFALLLAAAMVSTTVLSGCGGSKDNNAGAGDAGVVTEEGNNLVVQLGPDPETMGSGVKQRHRRVQHDYPFI